MIVEGQFLMYRNIVSKMYQIYSDEMQLALEDFMQELRTNNLEENGLFFYTINSDLRNTESLLVELFIPIKNNWLEKVKDDLNYRTLFFIDHMIMTRVKADVNDLESIGNETINLIEYCSKNGLEVHTPPFYKMRIDHIPEVYIEIYMGASRVARDEEELIRIILEE